MKKQTTNGPSGLTTLATLVSAIFLGTLPIYAQGATPSKEIIGEIATKDVSAEAQAILDKGQYLRLSGEVAYDLVVGNNGLGAVATEMKSSGEAYRGQLHRAQILEGGSLNIVGGDVYDTKVVGGELSVGAGQGIGGNGEVLWHTHGTATDTTVSGTAQSMGRFEVDDGAYANNSTINDRGWMLVSFYQGWDQAQGESLDYRQVQADNTTVNQGGILSVYRGGLVKDTVVNDGGLAVLNEGATAEGGFDVNGSGVVRLSSGKQYDNINTTFAAATAERISLHDGASELELLRLEGAPEAGRSLIQVGELMNNGAVRFATEAAGKGYIKAEVDRLSGSGLFDMRVGGMDGDFLNVTESVDGQFQVNVRDSGDELDTGSEGYHLIHANGSAQDSFSLVSGAVDLGAYKYYLNQDQTNGDDWHLSTTNQEVTPNPDPEPNPDPNPEPNPDPEPGPGPTPPKDPSNATSGVIALANAVPSVWDAELTTLRTRMGDMHAKDSHESGVWGKVISSRHKVNNFVAYKQDTNGFVLGADKSFARDGADLLVGGMMSYSNADIDYNRGGDGKVDSYSVGLYGTYLWDNGYYVDGVLKANRFSLTNNVKTQQGQTLKGKDSLYGFGASLEAGRHIVLDQYFVEPYAQLSAFKGQSSDYTLSNNLKADVDGAKSFKAELGATLGASFETQSKIAFKPYMRLAVSHEFADKNNVTINRTEKFQNDNSGTVVKYGLGVNADFKNQWSAFAELNYAKGYDGHVEMPYSGQVGVRYRF
ncbi:MAG: autotransporter outer membrane beta-barrel domain-containing protein [Neisseriaceae bacterium]|nr:autotransporter outer membrane beta-barrel domain-containing protein [Neisseriaceae bacterium]